MTRLKESILREMEKQLLFSLFPSFDLELDQVQRRAALEFMAAIRECLETGFLNWDKAIEEIEEFVAMGAKREHVLGTMEQRA